MVIILLLGYIRSVGSRVDWFGCFRVDWLGIRSTGIGGIVIRPNTACRSGLLNKIGIVKAGSKSIVVIVLLRWGNSLGWCRCCCWCRRSVTVGILFALLGWLGTRGCKFYCKRRSRSKALGNSDFVQATIGCRNSNRLAGVDTLGKRHLDVFWWRRRCGRRPHLRFCHSTLLQHQGVSSTVVNKVTGGLAVRKFRSRWCIGIVRLSSVPGKGASHLVFRFGLTRVGIGLCLCAGCGSHVVIVIVIDFMTE
mmetsp:Transcript_22250/g.46773  ORF Transcript_22250/g.46773 Transcript_22250/m.46773 type:complete len:250 (-) Transcript_22250:148-897(-)